MWVVFFNGVPSFWLLSGEVYRAGKKDCEVVIKDDRSISRTHVTFAIALNAAAATNSGATGAGSGGALADDDATQSVVPPVTLTDSSTYGTKLFLGTPPLGENSAESPPVQEVGITGLQYSRGVAANRLASASRKRSRSEQESAGPSSSGCQQLPKDSPYVVPATCTEFTLELGNHSARLRFAWVDLRAVVDGVDPDLHTKLAHHLQRCGVQRVIPPKSQVDPLERSSEAVAQCYRQCDFLVTDRVRCCGGALAMLCRAAPIVRPSYFAAVADRASPQVPLPDPAYHQPPLDSAWDALFVLAKSAARSSSTNVTVGEGKEATDEEVAVALLRPQPQRSSLFSSVHLVAIQRGVYAELAAYVGCAQGHVHYDDSLTALTMEDDESTRRVLEPFFVRHQRRVVVYAEGERMPCRNCVRLLRDQMRLCCVEYDAILCSVAMSRPLQLGEFPSESPNWSTLALTSTLSEAASTGATAPPSHRPTRSRLTDPNPMFPDLEAGGAAGVAVDRPAVDLTRQVDCDGWITRQSPDSANGEAGAATAASSAATARGSPSGREPAYVAEASASRPQLPPYPCFQSYDSTRRHRGPHDKDIPEGSHGHFHKQYVAPSEPPVELDTSYAARIAASLLTSRVPGVDADDIIPDQVVMGGTRSRAFTTSGATASAETASRHLQAGVTAVVAAFNAFDTAAHNAVQRRATTTSSRRGRGRAAGNRRSASETVGESRSLVGSVRQTGGPVPLATAVAVGVDEEGVEEVSAPPTAPARGGVYDVFDIEGIF